MCGCNAMTLGKEVENNPLYSVFWEGPKLFPVSESPTGKDLFDVKVPFLPRVAWLH